MMQKPPDQVLADDLARYSANLGQPFETRWTWFWRNRKAVKHMRTLNQTTPALVSEYRKGQASFRRALAQAQKEPRRQVRRLRWQLVFTSIGAVLRRFGWSILTILGLCAVAAGIWFSLPYLASLLETPPPAPSTTFSQPFGQGPR